LSPDAAIALWGFAAGPGVGAEHSVAGLSSIHIDSQGMAQPSSHYDFDIFGGTARLVFLTRLSPPLHQAISSSFLPYHCIAQCLLESDG
jgi:hypothetical protein